MRHRTAFATTLGLLLGVAPLAAAANTADTTGSATFHRDVLPILQKNCQACHRPQGLNLGGMVAPMSLLTYDEVRPWAKSIGKHVEARTMPPWHAAQEERGWFVDERFLTDAEIDTVMRWVRDGAPEGDPAAAPAPLAFPDNGGWAIGQPDLVVKMPVDHTIPDEIEDTYETFTQVLGEDVLPEDRWLKAVEFRPTGSFVHHIIARPLGGIAPGYQPRVFPAGHATLLRKGTKVSWQMHYHKEAGPGTAVTDNATYVALKFYQPGEVVTHIVGGDGLAVRGFRIPPGDPNYSKGSQYVFERDAYITALNPHMHLRGKAAKVIATMPDGSQRTLLDVPAYDFNWQHTYSYREPVFAPKGTQVDLTLWWDNSAQNPNNPDPTATVTFGQPTTAEMGFGFMKFVDAEPVHIVVGQDPPPAIAGEDDEDSESGER